MSYGTNGPAVLNAIGVEFAEDTSTLCDHVSDCQKKIVQAICVCASMSEGDVIQAGDESYDKAGWLKALQQLYDWLEAKCNAEPVAIVSSSNSVSC